MRADFSQITNEEITETQKLDQYWTNNWKTINNQRRPQWKIKAGPEFPVVMKTAPPPGPNVRVFDGGCGLGEWCLLLKETGYETYGLDLSTPTVASLNKEFPDMHFVREDIRKTNFEHNFFDLYISWGTFEHFENGLQDCFKEAYRIIKPGGKLIITVPFYNQRLKDIDKKEGNEMPENSEFYQWRLMRSELAEEFEKGGFSCDTLSPIYKHQGLSRHLHHRFGLPYGPLNRIISIVLSPFIPANRFAHMLIATGTKI